MPLRARACNYNRPLRPRSYFGAATGHPCAHLRAPPRVREDAITQPLHARAFRRSGLVQPVSLLSSGTPRAALSPLASPMPLSHRAELSRGHGTRRDLPCLG